MSLRARLLIASVTLVAVGLVVAGTATYRFLSTFLLDRVDQDLVQIQRLTAARLVDPGAFGPPEAGLNVPLGTYAALLTSGGQVLTDRSFGYPDTVAPDLPGALPGSGGVGEQALVTTGSETGDFEYRVLATAIPPAFGQGTLVTAVPLTDVEATLHRLVAVELIVGIAVLLAVGALAWWLVRLGLRPLEGIGETAGAIAAGDLSRRVEPADERTEVGRLGLALNAMLSQIEAAFEERRASESRLRRFVADASHELRTPLTSIRGYAELFRRGAGQRPEDLEKSMQRIEQEASRMGLLVDDLLLLARLDQGRPLEHKPVDLARVAAEAVEGARAVEPDRPIDLSAPDEAVVEGDEGRLRQVLDNLLDNARVHTPERTPVHVTLTAADGTVTVEVRDEGAGLDPETTEKLFERFYRGDPARSSQTGGAGLGLSIVAAIVEAHGGTVEVDAKEGHDRSQGTSFLLRLPRNSPVPPSSTTESSADGV